MFYFDRMYGELRFPPLIRDTLDCPGLLRLREVRMANIPFLSFPSFTGVTRYEHSLGVCHLAGIFADTVGLDEKDKLEIMLAALYHDASTPPFGHAVEEVLSILHGYNHEEKLREIIIGNTSEVGGQRTQFFLGLSLKLHKICQSKQARTLGLDVLRIADLAAGKLRDPLGDVISSSGIDLDNIDNVIRAVTAMGVNDFNLSLAEDLARSFVLEGDRVCFDEASLSHLETWKKARNTLYGMIFSSIEDFSLQTMLKHALWKLVKSSPEYQLRDNDWSMTDDELIFERLLKYSETREIVRRIRLGKVYNCLAYFMIEPKEQQNVKTIQLSEIEVAASQIFGDYIIKIRKRAGKMQNNNYIIPEVIANVYLDKRVRLTGRPYFFMGNQWTPNKENQPLRWILGLFTPFHRKWDKDAANNFREYLN